MRAITSLYLWNVQSGSLIAWPCVRGLGLDTTLLVVYLSNLWFTDSRRSYTIAIPVRADQIAVRRIHVGEGLYSARDVCLWCTTSTQICVLQL